MDWEAMAAPWLQFAAEIEALLEPARAAMFDAAQLHSGQSVLDIGPGSGVSLLEAAERVGRKGRVTGIEIAPPFAEHARARTPETVEILLGDAGSHTYQPGSHDAVISVFGVMFFADPVAAFANIRTALKPGRAMTFVCWGAPSANPWFGVSGRVLTEVLGPGPTFDPDAPGPMAFADPAKIIRILTDAGWTPNVETKALELTPPGSVDDVVTLMRALGGSAQRMWAAEAEGVLTDAHREAITKGLHREVRALETDDGVRVPAELHVVRAIA